MAPAASAKGNDRKEQWSKRTYFGTNYAAHLVELRCIFISGRLVEGVWMRVVFGL